MSYPNNPTWIDTLIVCAVLLAVFAIGVIVGFESGAIFGAIFK